MKRVEKWFTVLVQRVVTKAAAEAQGLCQEIKGRVIGAVRAATTQETGTVRPNTGDLPLDRMPAGLKQAFSVPM